MPVALIPAAISAGVGLYQTLFSGKRKAQRQLEQAAGQSPQYAGNKGVSDYYQEAYNRYMTSPENTSMYQNAMKNIAASQANSLSGLQDRRAALDAAGGLAASGMAAQGNVLANAEQQRNQRFGVLGQATGMQRADQMQQFNINRLMPYQNKLNLLTAKAQAANQRSKAGLQNIAGAAGAVGSYYGGTTAAERAASPQLFGGGGNKKPTWSANDL